VLADSAYGSGETRAALNKRRHRLAIKPWPTADTGRFGRDDFTVDHTARTATCPAGHTVAVTARTMPCSNDTARGCPIRSRCTTARDGRILKLSDHDIELVEARRAWRDGEFADDYRQFRPMVERSLAWLVRPGRRVAYRGIDRNRIWLAHRAAAVNLQRLVNLGLTHHDSWQLAPDRWARGLTRRERHLRRSAIQRGRISPSNIGSSVGQVPGPTNNATPHRSPTKERLAQQSHLNNRS
jgi:hypothetical protein